MCLKIFHMKILEDFLSEKFGRFFNWKSGRFFIYENSCVSFLSDGEASECE